MKKHELLKYAYDNYPKGTKFKNLFNKKQELTTGSFEVTPLSIFDVKTGVMLYQHSHGIWAEIIPEQPQKIAVKVENENEFDALMNYYDSLGWKWALGDRPADKKFVDINDRISNNIVYHDDIKWLSYYNLGYKIIPFSDFAAQHNIKLPLLKSEDGVWLYEGDEFCSVNKHTNEIDLFCGKRMYMLDSKSTEENTKDKNHLIFSTKQAALDWIEAQKPKSKDVDLGAGFYATVFKDRFEFKGCIPNGLKKEQLHDITQAMQELS